MIHQNRWAHGPRDFQSINSVNGSPARLGCTLQRTAFDKVVGEEVFLLFREESQYVRQYARVNPFNLLAHCGVAPTPHGLVGFVVWEIAFGSPQGVTMEQYINPYRIESLRLISSAANQSHFKLVILDNATGEVGAFVDFENVFGFDAFSSKLVASIGKQPEGNFAAATEWLMKTTSVAQLVARSALDVDGDL